MLNRWWSVSETCGELDTSLSFGVEDVEQCCATSRHIIIGATSPQAAPLWACQRLSMVKHLRRLLYFPVMCRMRYVKRAYGNTPDATNSPTTALCCHVA